MWKVEVFVALMFVVVITAIILRLWLVSIISLRQPKLYDVLGRPGGFGNFFGFLRKLFSWLEHESDSHSHRDIRVLSRVLLICLVLQPVIVVLGVLAWIS